MPYATVACRPDSDAEVGGLPEPGEEIGTAREDHDPADPGGGRGQHAEPASVAHTAKAEVDEAYLRCLRILISGPGYPMVATHDLRMVEAARAMAVVHGRSADDHEYQMLYGIRTAEQDRIAASGDRMRVYLPYGADWYGYFTRRLAERPANLAFFLRSLLSR